MARNENPPEVWFLAMAAALLAVFLLLAVTAYCLGAEAGGIFLAFLGFGVFIALLSNELVFRPLSIRYNDEGILLLLPLGRRRTVRWDTIVQIYAHQENPDTMIGRIERTGGIHEHNRVIPVGLTYELAMQAREEYTRRLGRRPPR